MIELILGGIDCPRFVIIKWWDVIKNHNVPKTIEINKEDPSSVELKYRWTLQFKMGWI